MDKKILSEKFSIFLRSVWLFPAVLTLVLVILTAFKINGSSAGIYQGFFYAGQKDSSLLANQPQPIRSDEFLVNTQLALAQSKAHYPEINKNLGNGEDMSLILDVPYKGWSEAFKPHNLAFFFLPFDYAFAFKWWVMAYLLLISCYFFVLSLLPGKRLIAASIAVSLLFSAFVQWWYQYITLAPLYYCLFLGTTVVHFLKQKDVRRKALLAVAITYLLVCFALVLYPPFQIVCGLALASFIIGELIIYFKTAGRHKLLVALAWLAACIIIAGALVGLYVITRPDAVHALNNTVYPGKRVVQAGGFSVSHLLSGQLGYQFNWAKPTEAYRLFGGPTNQSEAANFLLLTPFLFIPSLLLLYRDKQRKHQTDWALAGVNIVFVIFLLELFVHAFTPFSKLFLLDKVPLQRGLIGLGLLNVIQLALFIRNLSKKRAFPLLPAAAYSGGVLLIELFLGFYAHYHYPGFVGRFRLIELALPIPIVIYCLLRKKFTLAVVLFMLFSVFISIRINPLYRGLSVIENNALDVAVQQIVHKNPDAKWATEGLYLENFALLNGAHSLSGVYYYPQSGLWNHIGPGDQSEVYNRYAHANFQFTTTGNPSTTSLQLLGIDHFNIATNICGPFLRTNHVQYVLTPAMLSGDCIVHTQHITMPAQTFYIYQLKQ